MNPKEILYVGIKGQVVAFEKSTGRKLWSKQLKSSAFVNVVLDGDLLFAHTSGELFALDAVDGTLLWQDGLSGFGYGMATLVTANAPNNSQAVRAEYQFEQERQNNSSSTSASTGATT